MSGDILTCQAVRFDYSADPVLDGVDLSVATGKVTALMGPSGCGKSTLMAIAANLLQPVSGRVRRSYKRAGVMFQDPLLLPWRTARDNVGFALKADGLPRSQRRERAQGILARVGLAGEDIGKYPHQLSGGMRQRVSLARALVIAPDLLLLDEPFTGLDASLSAEMLALVRTLVETDGISALVVTHDARQAARFAEQVYVLSPVPAKIVTVHDFRSTTRSEAEIAADAETILIGSASG